MKLYLVRCQGMQSSTAGQTAWGQAFVIAENPDEAYKTLRAFLDSKDIGFQRERELMTVELVADSYEYGAHPIRLYMAAPSTRSQSK